MKKIIHKLACKIFLFFIVTDLVIAFSLVGCQSLTTKSSENIAEISIQKDFLVVERHQVCLDWNSSITADLPILNYSHLESDSKYLSDSVGSLINRELHSLLDDCIERTEKEKAEYYKQTMTDPDEPIYDLEEIQNEYQDIKEENVGGQWISFILIAQTESFVTYGFEYYHCAGSCGSEFHCYTFSKKDGHRINRLITWEDIKRFINDHPETIHPFGHWQLEAENSEINDSHLFDAGLLNDGLLLVNEDEVNHYVLGKISYKDILPYLSKEAQEHGRAIGDVEQYNRERWYLGRCIGEVKDKEDVGIRLMERKSLWLSFSNLNYTGENDSSDKEACYLTAYKECDNIYKPVKIFEQNEENGISARLEFIFPDSAYEGPAFDDVFFTCADKILYAPYLDDNNKVVFVPFKYDGHLFKKANLEDTKPQGSIIGKLVTNTKDTICLVHILKEASPVVEGVSAYYMRNGLYVPARIFPNYKTKMSSLLGDESYVSSHPKGQGFVFDPKTKDVYAIKSERTTMGGFGCFDRYKVFCFNGMHYFFDKEDGGFWLHPSVREFGRLLYLGKSKGYLVRIDEMRSYDWRGMNEEDNEAEKRDTCRYRYTSWKNKDSMESAPDAIIENGYWNLEKGCFVFENDGYIYEVYRNYFEVYHGKKKILEQKLHILTSAYDG